MAPPHLFALLFAILLVQARALVSLRQSRSHGQACLAEDLQHRAQLQDKLAGLCEDMCKEVGSYPSCPGCPNFVPPDPTPGVMTWDELLTHMDNLGEWGRGQIKEWWAEKNEAKLGSAEAQPPSKADAAFLAVHKSALAAVRKVATDGQACLSEDLKHRSTFQNKLAGLCEDMCKEVGSYPSCPGCPNFVAPDPTPGVMTWDELP